MRNVDLAALESLKEQIALHEKKMKEERRGLKREYLIAYWDREIERFKRQVEETERFLRQRKR